MQDKPVSNEFCNALNIGLSMQEFILEQTANKIQLIETMKKLPAHVKRSTRFRISAVVQTKLNEISDQNIVQKCIESEAIPAGYKSVV